jgi:DNA-binding MarR family transcriptional regulator
MRRGHITAALLAIGTWLYAQTTQHTSPEVGVAYLVHNDSVKQIDFHRGRIASLHNTGWVKLDSFEVLPDPMRLLLHPTPIVTQTPDTTLIHFTGSGLVYTLRKNGKLERLDRTFYSGYNYGAIRYYDGRRLWSLGGSGLWNVQDLAIFYDSELREWERRIMTPSIHDGFTNGMYSPNSPGVLTAIVQDGTLSTKPEPTYTVYEMDLTKASYLKLGVAAARDRGPKFHELTSFGQWGTYTLSHCEGRLYLADLVANQLLRCEPLIDVYSNPFNGTHGILISPNKLYMIQTASTITNVHVKIERWSYDELLSQLKPTPIGPIYESDTLNTVKTNWKGLLLIFVSFVTLSVLILRYQRSRPSVERNFALSLSPSARIILRHLLLQSPDSLVTPDELNQILGIEDKTWDNQRKIRSTMLQELEEKGMQYLGVPSFIERVASEEDRRIRRYRIKPEFRDDLLPILKHV